MLTLLYSPHMTSVDNETKRASGHAYEFYTHYLERPLIVS